MYSFGKENKSRFFGHGQGYDLISCRKLLPGSFFRHRNEADLGHHPHTLDPNPLANPDPHSSFKPSSLSLNSLGHIEPEYRSLVHRRPFQFRHEITLLLAIILS
jgi:hypothetical protein